MPDLTPMEVKAGISRAAIETMNGRRNGHKTRALPSADLEVKPDSEPTPELTHVLITHRRQLDLINVNGWSFQIRDTHFALGTVQSGSLHLTRPELERLEQIIHRVLDQAGPPRAEEL